MASLKEEKVNYKEWSHENLIKRVTELEHNLKLKNAQFVLLQPFHWNSAKTVQLSHRNTSEELQEIADRTLL